VQDQTRTNTESREKRSCSEDCGKMELIDVRGDCGAWTFGLGEWLFPTHLPPRCNPQFNHPDSIDSFSGPTPAPPTNNNNKTNELKLAWISPCPCLVRPSHGLLGNSPTFPNFRGSAYTLDRHSHGDKGPHAPPLTADTGLPYKFTTLGFRV